MPQIGKFSSGSGSEKLNQLIEPFDKGLVISTDEIISERQPNGRVLLRLGPKVLRDRQPVPVTPPGDEIEIAGFSNPSSVDDCDAYLASGPSGGAPHFQMTRVVISADPYFGGSATVSFTIGPDGGTATTVNFSGVTELEFGDSDTTFLCNQEVPFNGFVHIGVVSNSGAGAYYGTIYGILL